MELRKDELKQEFEEQAELYKNELGKQDEKMDMSEASMRFAYIVFRSMDAIDALQSEYSQGACKRFCITKCFCLCCPAKAKAIYKKHFFKQWPNFQSPACEPDNIQWNNLGIGSK